VLQRALETANIDIVGGDGAFFDQITRALRRGKSVDRIVGNSEVLRDVKETFFNGDPEYFKAQLRKLVDQVGMSSEDLRNLTLTALITRLMQSSEDEGTRGLLQQGMGLLERLGIGNQPASIIAENV
jgi:hypothetical protein